MSVNTITDEELLKNYDATQVQLMQERCILVDENDKAIGYDTKKKCHLNVHIAEGLLHRAFSIFLFNSKGQLLLQQRASDKITFPDFWTNTVCSHPLHFLTAKGTECENQPELEEEEQIGVKRAAKRKLEHELGIKIDDEKKFQFLTRILYKSDSCSVWGEHEIDYCLILQEDVEVNPNPNEVSNYKYYSMEELKEFIASSEEKGIKLTPWFKLIVENFLYKWWADLSNLSQFQDNKVHQMRVVIFEELVPKLYVNDLRRMKHNFQDFINIIKRKEKK